MPFGLQKLPAGIPLPVDLERLRNISALIVDDNATARAALRAMLRRWHMKPHEVGNGEQAIAMLQAAKNTQQAYQLILLDAQMPEMDGFSVAARIKRDLGLPQGS